MADPAGGDLMADTQTRSAAGTFISERQPGETLDRETVIRMLSDSLKTLHLRTSAGRFVVKKTDPQFLAMVRVLIQASIAFNTLTRDSDLDELAQQVKELMQAEEQRQKRRQPI